VEKSGGGGSRRLSEKKGDSGSDEGKLGPGQFWPRVMGRSKLGKREPKKRTEKRTRFAALSDPMGGAPMSGELLSLRTIRGAQQKSGKAGAIEKL